MTMNYEETIDFLYNVAPLFQNIGANAYKEGLESTYLLDEYFGHPHQSYKTIHVGGTNGKGSVSHTLAAILQSAGLRVGLYTSPHLVDFRERIRVNGEMIPKQRVIDFVEDMKTSPLGERLEGGFSFFELTTALAFQYFKEQQVDVAVIEVGLGGRLDCTNIITPILSVVTNISLEHTQLLGDTLEKIAHEKAGIIKPHTPAVIGETHGQPEVRKVFSDKALETNSEIIFADEKDEIIMHEDGSYVTRHFGTIKAELRGLCQEKNTATILAATEVLRTKYFELSDESIREGFLHVCELTGLMGRWQQLRKEPTVICDTGHNPAGLQYIAKQLTEALALRNEKPSNASRNDEQSKASRNEKQSVEGGRATLRIVLGMAGDKDVRASLALLPHEATYYFTQASVHRAMKANEIAALGRELGLKSHTDAQGQPTCYSNVASAYEAALASASPEDIVFVGGSSFVVADLLKES